VAVVGDNHVEVPVGCALTVTVYVLASAVFVAFANSMLETVEVGRVIRLGVVPAGEIVTWYSITADPQYI
jgi:hypothetical protein